MYKTENMNIGMLNTVEDFLKDDSFIRYALDGSKKKDSDWDIYYEKHPENRDAFEEAKAVLLAPSDIDSGLLLSEKEDLKNWILESIEVKTEI